MNPYLFGVLLVLLLAIGVITAVLVESFTVFFSINLMVALLIVDLVFTARKTKVPSCERS